MSTTEQNAVGLIGRAKYRSGNIISYPFIAFGIFLLANAAFIPGLLLTAGGLVLMPRVARYLWDVPNIAGWALVIAAVLALPK